MRRVKSNLTKRAAWLHVVDEYKASGLSVSAFSERKKINLHTLRYWIRKSATGADESKSTSLFVEARARPQPTSPSSGDNSIVLTLVTGVRLEIPASVSGSWLASLVRELA